MFGGGQAWEEAKEEAGLVSQKQTWLSAVALGQPLASLLIQPHMAQAVFGLMAWSLALGRRGTKQE